MSSLVDVGRVFPPIWSSTAYEPVLFLYGQFRPEFMRVCPLSVSSDALSQWDRHSFEQSSQDVKQARDHLLGRVVPALAMELCDICSALAANIGESLLPRLNLSVLFHRRGVNMRLLGAVRLCVAESGKRFSDADLQAPSDAVRCHVMRLLLEEMVLRAAKTVFNDTLRCVVRPEDEEYLLFAAAFLYHALDDSEPLVHDHSRYLWYTALRRALERKFYINVSDQELDELRTTVWNPSPYLSDANVLDSDRTDSKAGAPSPDGPEAHAPPAAATVNEDNNDDGNGDANDGAGAGINEEEDDMLAQALALSLQDVNADAPPSSSAAAAAAAQVSSAPASGDAALRSLASLLLDALSLHWTTDQPLSRELLVSLRGAAPTSVLDSDAPATEYDAGYSSSNDVDRHIVAAVASCLSLQSKVNVVQIPPFLELREAEPQLRQEVLMREKVR